MENIGNYYLSLLAGRFGEPSDLTSARHPVNYARALIARDLPVLFDAGHLAHCAGVDPSALGYMRSEPAHFYTMFLIAKRSGGSRMIAAPTPELKRVQTWIQRNITRKMYMHDAAHAFRRGRSIATNAVIHTGADVVLQLDLTDFFASVHRRQVFEAFRSLGYSREVTRVLVGLTTLGAALPQGAPTSPDLANRAAARMDRRLAALAAKRGIRYSRYADDLTFSGPRLAVHGPKLKRMVELIIRSEGFRPNRRKTRYRERSDRQLVTGLVVNEAVNVPRERRRWLRQELHYLERFGVEEHMRARRYDRENYRAFIYGHACALTAVDPPAGRKIIERLDEIRWPY